MVIILYNQIMKRTIIFLTILLTSCATNTQYGLDGTSNKNWLELVSSRDDHEGKQYDSCYKFNFTVWPQAAEARINKEHNCVTRCCWRSERESVVINLNEGLAEELEKNGKAFKYTPEKITINVKYSSLLDLTNATVSPAGIISRDGHIKLNYEVLSEAARTKEISLAARLAAEEAARKADILKERMAAQTAIEEARVANLQADYNKRQAINYTRRFYGLNIDKYLSLLDQAERQKGYTLLFGQKTWAAMQTDTSLYTVSCYAPASLGKTQKSMKNITLECGLWQVDLEEQTVVPIDTLAGKIVK